ncbi:MAG: hypothetical protein ACHP9Y_02840, partial [Gammaproteobacteria bacterium]
MAMELSNEAAVADFAAEMDASEQQSESMKDLPSLEMDPSQMNMDSVVEVTMVDYMVQQAQGDGPAAAQIQVNNDGTMSITAQGVEAFAQSFPELAAQNGGAQGIYSQVSASAANTANASAATAGAATASAATAGAATASNASPTATQNTSAQVTAQMGDIIARGSAASTLAAAAAMVAAANVAPAQSAVQPQVASQSSSVTLSMGR